MGRVRMEIELRVGEGDSIEEDLAFTRDMDQQFDTLAGSASDVFTLEPREHVMAPLSDVTSIKLVYIEANGDVEVTFDGVPGAKATILGDVFSEPTGFVGGEAFAFLVDQAYVMGVFTADAQSAEQVIAELNAQAANAGCQYDPFTLEGGAIRVSGKQASDTCAVVNLMQLSAIGFGDTKHVIATNPSGNTTVYKLTRPASETERTGLKAVLLATVEASTVAIKNQSDLASVEARVCIVGDYPPPV